MVHARVSAPQVWGILFLEKIKEKVSAMNRIHRTIVERILENLSEAFFKALAGGLQVVMDKFDTSEAVALNEVKGEGFIDSSLLHGLILPRGNKSILGEVIPEDMTK